jgi:hypothetical protein
MSLGWSIESIEFVGTFGLLKLAKHDVVPISVADAMAHVLVGVACETECLSDRH